MKSAGRRNKVLTVVGARPQFVKCSPVSKILRNQLVEILIHTGQHYDSNLSEIFFKELMIPKPEINLGIGSDSHAVQTGKMMIELEKTFNELKPDIVLIYGDTNSTLSAALAAAKLNIPIAHVEAGLRSYNRLMPEEINRILSDKLSSLLFCPTPTSTNNLKKEGIDSGVHYVGDVMYDAILQNVKIAESKSNVLNKLGLIPEAYYLATIHRAENTDNPENLKNILSAFRSLDKKVILPLHPRTFQIIKTTGLRSHINDNINIIDPLSYLDMIAAQKNTSKIFTDSGGIQKEAYFLRRPCITIRNETEWTETIDMGVNVLTGTSPERIIDAALNFDPSFESTSVFGDGNASEKIVEILLKFLQTGV